MTYFNPPYSQNIQTNVGELFFKALDKCFPSNHPLKKVMNRNTIKLSYRCMPNLKRHISRHNGKILRPEREQAEIPSCNCRTPPCPMDGKCLSTRSVVYRATVTDENNNKETYTGLTKNTFKQRYYSHKNSFKKRKKEHDTTLSAHIWKLKDGNTDFNISWSPVETACEFDPTTRKCMLCLKEKFHIIFQPSGATLNQRSELFSTCRHRLAKLLENT